MLDMMHGDCIEHLRQIPDESVALTITSPPYNIGKPYEKVTNLANYVQWQSSVLQEVFRATKPGGSVCWQVGNCIVKGAVYPIDCLLFPEFSKIGFTPRNRIIWHFGHGLHCKNRFSGRHETIMWFTKGDGYTFNLDAVRVPSKYPGKKHYKGEKKGQLSGNPLGKNPDDVWSIPNVKHNHPEKTAHPCQFPEELSDRLIKALTNNGDVVLDPFMGSGTTAVSARRFGREFIGIERDASYMEIARRRIENTASDNGGQHGHE